MSGDIAVQDFCQTHAACKRKDPVQMIPIVILVIEDESDRDNITGLLLHVDGYIQKLPVLLLAESFCMYSRKRTGESASGSVRN